MQAPIEATASGSTSFATRAVDIIDRVAKACVVLALVAELCIVLADVTGRYLFNYSLVWGHEASKLALSTIAFMGGAIAYKSGHHTTVRVVTNALSPALREYVLIAIDATVLIVSILIEYVLFVLVQVNNLSVMPILRISAAWIDIPAVVGMVLLMLFCIERLVFQYTRRRVAWTVPTLVAVTAVIVFLNYQGVFAFDSDMSLAVMLVLFFVTVLLGLPVGFAMLFSTIVYLTVSNSVPMIAVPQNMIDGTGSFILLALPFFIFVGTIMEKGGISVRLVEWAMALVGHLRGGILQVMVLTMYLVAGISGSKTADVAAVGSVMRTELTKQGYRPEEGVAVLSAAAAMSETIPPSIGMLVLGSVAPISIGTLFLAGIVPAAVVALCLMAAVYLRSVRKGSVRRKRAPFKVVVKTGIAAVPALMMPAIMVVGIKAGIATPTEASAVAVFYGLVLAVFVYRAMDLKALYKIAVESIVISGMVLFIIAAAFSFSWALSAAYLPQDLVTLIHGTSKPVFLIESIVFLVIIGSLLEGLPALIILGPLLLPLANQLGIDSIHYAILLLLAMGTGIFMPPIGVGFYVANAVMGAKTEPAAKEIVPFLIVLMIGVLLVAFIPWFTSALPNAFGE